jgi:hypothetical protein
MERTVTKIDLTEITKLHNLLTEAKIPHTYLPLDRGMQIRVYADKEMTNELDDVICTKYSCGREKGLLETYRLNGCEGCETAEEVFEGWMKWYHKAREVKENA